jgi:hypothetical protein
MLYQAAATLVLIVPICSEVEMPFYYGTAGNTVNYTGAASGTATLVQVE